MRENKYLEMEKRKKRCLVEVPNAPRHRAERAHAKADYDEETAFDNYFNPEAGHRAGPEGPTDA